MTEVQETPLVRAVKAADAADKAYGAACSAAGFKSRWDVSAKVKETNPQIRAAYKAKLAADVEQNRAFEADRLHRAGRTKAGNDISGI